MIIESFKFTAPFELMRLVPFFEHSLNTDFYWCNVLYRTPYTNNIHLIMCSQSKKHLK